MSGALGRRALLKGALGLAAASSLVACLPTPFPRPARGPSGSLLVGLGADPAGLDPLLQTGLLEAGVYSNIFDPLVTHDADGTLQPALAESYRALDDRTWEFRLRSGVSFHNGEPFDSTSVRATVERMLDPASKSVARAQLDAIERVETPDSQTALLVTREPFAPLLAELTGLMMLPPRALAEQGQDALGVKPIGTGPFRFVEWVRDERLVLEADDRHWRGAPSIRRLEFRPRPEPASRMAELRAGRVDLATNVPADMLPTLQREGLRILERPGVQALYLRLNARKPPLDDLRVRRAIVRAVDVDRLIGAIYGGHARRINGPFPPEVFGYDPAAPLQPYDPEQARLVLRQAGLENGFTLTLETPRGRYPGDDQVALVIAEQLGSVGITVDIRAVEWGAYLAKVQAGQGEHLFLLAGTNRTFDPHFTIIRLFADSSAFGKFYYGNPEIGPLAAEAAGALDPNRRRALYARILGILRDDAPALWLAQLPDLYAARGLAWDPPADSLLWMYSARREG